MASSTCIHAAAINGTLWTYISNSQNFGVRSCNGVHSYVSPVYNIKRFYISHGDETKEVLPEGWNFRTFPGCETLAGNSLVIYRSGLPKFENNHRLNLLIAI